jgi:hypothetical protein
MVIGGRKARLAKKDWEIKDWEIKHWEIKHWEI